MRKVCLLVTAVCFGATASFAQTETTQQKRDHEMACIAGTATGVLLGVALGGFFGGGAGKALMQVAGGAGGGLLTHKLSCKKKS